MELEQSKLKIVTFLESRRGSSPAGSLWAFWLCNEWDQKQLEPALGSLALEGRVTLEDGFLRLRPEHGTVEAKITKHLAAAWAGLEIARQWMTNLEQERQESMAAALKAELPQLTLDELHAGLQRFLERAFAILSVGPE